MVGGLARTESYKGFYFDIGGHRFFTKSADVQKMWQEVLGDAFLRRPRLSRIYYHKTFFFYPLKPFNALKGLGLFESLRIIVSYLQWQLFPYRREDSFEQWVTNRFGKRLFLTFFKTYTEKVWGIPCSELKAEWAAQRIKDLSLKTAVLNMFLKPKQTIKTLIEEFDYPRLGPGMMWNAVKDRVEKQGGVVWMNTDVVGIHRRGNRIHSVVVSCEGHQELIQGTDFISSMAVTEFIQRLDPPPPPAVLKAAAALKYRDFLTICLIVDQPDLFPDNWIYIHAPEVKVGRIQNFKNWSPDMVPDPTKTSLGLEYFCNEGDALWNMPDAELIESGKREVERLGLARYADVEDGCVFRAPKSYPVYDSEYRGYLAIVREFVDSLENFQTIGRNGLHRYNNQDHAMLTGMLAVRNLILGEKSDLWSVNADREYHEEIRGTAESVSKKFSTAEQDRV
jgi:protoporphyrinogen oxidase